MPSQRHDYTPQSPPDKYGLPGLFYPTNDRAAFVVIVEDVPLESARAALPAYTQHPNTGGSTGNAVAVLTLVAPTKGDGTRKNVRMTYETLPGPWLYDIRDDDLLGFVQVKRRAVRTDPTTQSGATSATGKTVYQSRDGSPLVSWEIVERWGNGTGTPSGDGFPNTPFPILRSSDWDRERGTVSTATQIVVAADGQNASLAYADGVVTEITYEAYPGNDALKRKVTKTFSLPGPLLTGKILDDLTGLKIPQTTQLVWEGSDEPEITNYFTDYARQAVDSVTSRDVTKVYPEAVTGVTRIDWVPDAMTWPSVWVGIGGVVTSLADLANFHIDAERPVKFSRRETTTFQTAMPSLSDIMTGVTQIIPVRHDLRTVNINFISGPVLSDSFTISGVTFPASTPTASDYLLSRGSTTLFLKQPRRTRQIAHSLWAVTLPELPYV